MNTSHNDGSDPLRLGSLERVLVNQILGDLEKCETEEQKVWVLKTGLSSAHQIGWERGYKIGIEGKWFPPDSPADDPL